MVATWGGIVLLCFGRRGVATLIRGLILLPIVEFLEVLQSYTIENIAD